MTIQGRGTIMIVDDEATIRENLQRFFRTSGYDASVASNGEDALDLARRRVYEVALLDIRMPGMTGVDLLRRLRTDYPDTEVIMMTGVSDVITAVECMRLGAFDYVLKPFALDEMLIRATIYLTHRFISGILSFVGRTTMKEPKTLIEAIRYFADPDVCLDLMINLRWPHGVTCPTCGSQDVSFISTRRLWTCKEMHTKRQFSVKVGTVFEDSPIALDKWLTAIWLITNAKNGVSSYEVARDLGVTQKTAWFMMHRIRLAMGEEPTDKFSGRIEVDETFIGGKARFMHKAKRAEKIHGTGGMGKTAVMGLLERHGSDEEASRVRTKVVADRRRKSLSSEVRQHVVSGSEVFTDALKSYDDLGVDYVHQVIDHAESYVKGQIHTNGIENFWSLLKRAIRGTYVNVEPFHLFRYLDEETFRYNTRKTTDATRFGKVARGVSGKRLTYAQLTGQEALT